MITWEVSKKVTILLVFQVFFYVELDAVHWRYKNIP